MVSKGWCYCPHIWQIYGFIKGILWRPHYFKRRVAPPCSPYLNPPDFYLWGAAKSAVYRDCPCTLDDLQAVITAFIQSISSEQLIAVFRNKIRKVQACIDAKGVTFNIIYNCHSYLPPVFYSETCVLINK